MPFLESKEQGSCSFIGTEGTDAISLQCNWACKINQRPGKGDDVGHGCQICPYKLHMQKNEGAIAKNGGS